MQYKKQHWIPQSYLQEWCDPDSPKDYDNYVWIFPVDGGIIKRKSPANIFYESEMYTIHLQDGSRVLDIEHGLSGLEDAFSSVRRNSLESREIIDCDAKLVILAFIAASLSRTRAQRNHEKNQWGKLYSFMKKIKEQMRNATPDERKTRASLETASSNIPTYTMDDVRKLASEPLQETLIASILSQVELFQHMNLSILCTTDDIGFITSDAPCVWCDPEAYKRSFPYGHPGLDYPNIEISLPISPRQIAFLTHKTMDLYIDIPEQIVDELNRRTRFFADEYFVVRKNATKAIWFDKETPTYI